jgi:hypothetical protein
VLAGAAPPAIAPDADPGIDAVWQARRFHGLAP